MNESYQTKMEAQLREWGHRIEEMQGKADSPDHPLSGEDVATLRALHKAAFQKLNDMKQSGEEGWEDHRADLDNRWDELRKAFTAIS
ncbi:MAG: hypothetical protein WD490_09760, partial [Opitutales bacterium]